VGCYVHDLNEHAIPVGAIDHSILLIQPAGSVATPIPFQRLIAKPFDHAKTSGTGDPDYVLPFFVPLQDLDRQFVKLLPGSAVLIDLPHRDRLYIPYMICQGRALGLPYQKRHNILDELQAKVAHPLLFFLQRE